MAEKGAGGTASENGSIFVFTNGCGVSLVSVFLLIASFL
jgi:hypothetical protein